MVEVNREFLLKKYGKDKLISLTSVDLSKNQIRRIDINTFKGLINLEELILKENEIEEIDVRLFDSLSNLKKLNLSNNKLKRIDADTFKELTKLEYLNLGINQITEIDAKLFESLSNLEWLLLFHNKLKKIDSNTFKRLTNIKWLWFDYNSIEEIDVSLFESLSNLKHLIFNNNKLKRIDPNVFKHLTKLECLEFAKNEIEEIDARLFESLSSLKALYLYNVNLKRIDSNSFNKLINLECLYLNNNQIEEIDARLFESLSNLKLLYLYNNKIKRIDSSTFKRLTNLEWLYLNRNSIEEIDVSLFESLSNLKYLTLNNNKLTIINRKCFDPLTSIKVISLYENNYEFFSYDNRSSESFNNMNCYWRSSGYTWTIFPTINNLRCYEFKTNWNDFLEQFPQSKSPSIIKRDPLIGELIHRRYKVKDVLGEGSFGKVYLVQDQKESNSLEKAIKTMKKGAELNKQSEEHTNEVELMKRIKHENIIRYYEHFDETISGSQYFCFVCEFCENGDLKKQIEQAEKNRKKFSELKILRWISEATNGLKNLHSEKIIHRDIKPANILLSKHNVIKLADFGLSKYTESSVASSLVGSRAYMSPELIQCFVDVDATYTKKTDIWSLGCVLYELIYLKIAFPTGVKIRSPLPDFGISRFAPFLKSMLEIKEERRINAKNLYEMLNAERAAMEE